MNKRRFATACIATSLVLTPAGSALADNGLVGGIVGGVIGGIIVNEANKSRSAPRTTTTTTTRSSSSKSTVSSAQREENRQVQTALNYFGFPVGTPDGAIGPKSRAAITEYQMVLGYPATGQLTDFETQFLITSYYRAQAGGAATHQAIATNPMGARGLLVSYRDQQFAPPPPAGQAGTVAATPEAAPAAPAPVLPLAIVTPGLPTFMAAETTSASLASQCNKVSLLTNTNGGYTTVAAMQDPVFALSEQFCLARTYAMSQGEDLAAKVAGATPAQIAEQCQSFGPVLAPQVAALSVQGRDEVLAVTSDFVLASGMAPAQLAATAKICLGIGYTTDKQDVAIGSALILTALGERGYAELVGQHLSQGFGTSQRPDLALGWYDMGLKAESIGASVFAPGLPGRSELIRKAAYAVAGRPEAPAVPAVLPTFSLSPSAPAAVVAP